MSWLSKYWPAVFVAAIWFWSIAVARRRNPGFMRLRRQPPQTLNSASGPVLYRRIYPRYNKGRETSPPGVEFAREVESGGAFEILSRKRNRRLDLPLLTQRLDLQSPIWDGKVWVSAPDGTEIKRLLSEAGGAIDKLLNLEAAVIEHDGRELIVRWTPYREPLEGVTTFPFLDDAAEALAKIAPLLPRLYPKEQPVARGYLRAKRFFGSPLAIIAGVFAFVGGMVAAATASRWYMPCDWGQWGHGLIPTMLAIFVGFLSICTVFIRRYHLPAIRVRAFLLFGVMASWPVGWALFTGSNGLLDREPAQLYTLDVTRYSTSVDKRDTYYHAEANTTDGPGTVERTITHSAYRKLEAGEPAQLTTHIHPGYWGVRWSSDTHFQWKAQ